MIKQTQMNYSFYIKPAQNGIIIEVYDKEFNYKGSVIAEDLSSALKAIEDLDDSSIDTEFEEN